MLNIIVDSFTKPLEQIVFNKFKDILRVINISKNKRNNKSY